MNRSEFREVIEAELDVAMFQGDTRKVLSLKRLLRNKRALKRVHRRSAKAANKRHGGSIMDWLADGGWEQLMEWIMYFIDLFSGEKQ